MTQLPPQPTTQQLQENMVQTTAFLVKMEVIRRLFWFSIIVFITVRLLSHIDYWVETIWRRP